jgi:hypothetical protein
VLTDPVIGSLVGRHRRNPLPGDVPIGLEAEQRKIDLVGGESGRIGGFCEEVVVGRVVGRLSAGSWSGGDLGFSDSRAGSSRHIGHTGGDLEFGHSDCAC